MAPISRRPSRLPRHCRLDASTRRLLLHLCRLLCGRGGCRDDRCRRKRCHAHGDTDKGPVEIPTNLQTIVSDYYLGEFLAVDVKPSSRAPTP